MSLNATRIRVEALTRELQRSWDETRGSWRDAKGEEFDARHMPELAVRVEKASAAMEKLDFLLNRIRGDCE